MANTPKHEANEQQLELALRMARTALDGTEKLLRLQLDMVKQTLEDTAQQSVQLAGAKDIPTALSIRTKYTEQTARSMLELSQNVYELATQTQAELARHATAQLGAGQTSLMGHAAAFAPMSGPLPDMFGGALESSMAATQAAYESMTKAAKQVAEFADTSLKAATTATASAMKQTTAKK